MYNANGESTGAVASGGKGGRVGGEQEAGWRQSRATDSTFSKGESKKS